MATTYKPKAAAIDSVLGSNNIISGFANWLSNPFAPQTKSSTTSSSAKKEDTSPKLLSDYTSIIDGVLGSAPVRSGGVSSIDLNPMISAYTQGANAQKDIIKNEGQNKRQSLLETLKRLQEDTISGKKDLQQSYQGARSSIEDNAFMNTRAIRASNAAKGLGASGLESLGILKGAIQAGNDISGIANKNMNDQGKLTLNLTRGTKDINDEVNRSISEEALKIAGIDSNLANQIATLQMNEKQRVSAANAAAGANYNSSLNSYNNNKKVVETQIKDAQNAAASILNKFLNLSVKDQKNSSNKINALNQLDDLSATLGTILPTSDVKMLKDAINSAYKKAGGK